MSGKQLQCKVPRYFSAGFKHYQNHSVTKQSESASQIVPQGSQRDLQIIAFECHYFIISKLLLSVCQSLSSFLIWYFCHQICSSMTLINRPVKVAIMLRIQNFLLVGSFTLYMWVIFKSILIKTLGHREICCPIPSAFHHTSTIEGQYWTHIWCADFHSIPYLRGLLLLLLRLHRSTSISQCWVGG